MNAKPTARLIRLAAFLSVVCILGLFVTTVQRTAVSRENSLNILFEEVDEARLQREQNELGGTKPIYGDDDRMDWGKIEDRSVKAVAAASVALFKTDAIEKTESGTFRINAVTLEDRHNLCAGQRFMKQLSGAFCSGVLIEEDVVLTAGHCIAESSQGRGVKISDTKLIFGFVAESQKDPGRAIFDSSRVFAVRELLQGKELDDGEDWAALKLDRPVPMAIAEPVRKIRRTKIENNTPVYVVGYPDGLPLKYARNAKVTKNDGATFFVANLDTFQGNSGSGVFSRATNELVGLLSSGEIDYHRAKIGFCNEAYLCPRYGCRGEAVTRIELIRLP